MKSKRDTHVAIFVINCGSSSLKYRLIRMPEETVIMVGEAERVGIKTQASGLITHTVLGKQRHVKVDMPDHTAAFKAIMSLVYQDVKNVDICMIDVFAHRYVHPGHVFSQTTRVTKDIMGKLKDTLGLAPLHNPICFSVIESCAAMYPSIPQYVVFDTSFHSTIPKELAAYALPQAVVR